MKRESSCGVCYAKKWEEGSSSTEIRLGWEAVWCESLMLKVSTSRLSSCGRTKISSFTLITGSYISCEFLEDLFDGC